jgi:hypothetical protein
LSGPENSFLVFPTLNPGIIYISTDCCAEKETIAARALISLPNIVTVLALKQRRKKVKSRRENNENDIVVGIAHLLCTCNVIVNVELLKTD